MEDDDAVEEECMALEAIFMGNFARLDDRRIRIIIEPPSDGGKQPQGMTFFLAAPASPVPTIRPKGVVKSLTNFRASGIWACTHPSLGNLSLCWQAVAGLRNLNSLCEKLQGHCAEDRLISSQVLGGIAKGHGPPCR